MAVEKKRGCGYRKIGGLYLCAEAPNASCCRFPFPLDICPVCGQGVKQSRNVQWFEPRHFIKGECKTKMAGCAFNLVLEKAILIWIGVKFYATPEHFLDEAKRMGISRRIKAIPKRFEVGKTAVYFAHSACYWSQENKYAPGVFGMVVPTKFELIVPDNPTKEEEEKIRRRLKDTRITPVVVPGHDADHHYFRVDDPELEEIWNETDNGNDNEKAYRA